LFLFSIPLKALVLAAVFKLHWRFYYII